MARMKPMMLQEILKKLQTTKMFIHSPISFLSSLRAIGQVLAVSET